jgi:hypothetical protein
MRPFWKRLTVLIGTAILCATNAFGASACGGNDSPRCGDGVCNNGETPRSCTLDCGVPADHCGDGYCNFGERANTCPEDCGGGGTNGGTNGGTTTSCGPDHLPVNPSGVRLGVSPLPQLCSEWCWASVSTMVASYYGIGATECGLASIRNSQPPNACCFQNACQFSQCNTPAPPLVIESMLRDVLGIRGQSINNGLTERQVLTELSNGRPIIVGYLNSVSGHVVLVYGYVPNGNGGFSYLVADPFYGPFTVSYNQLAYGYVGGGTQWRWGYTAYRLSPRTDACNTQFDSGCICR